MDFKDHLQLLRMVRVKRYGARGISKGVLIRQIYEIIKDHEGKDFKDLNDLFQQLFPPRTVQPVPFGVNIRSKKWQRRARRESPFYDTEVEDLEQET